MENQNPYDKLLDEINALLQMLEANKGATLDDSRLPADALARMQQLEQKAKAFEEMAQKAVEVTKDIPPILKELMPTTDVELPPEAKRVINRSKDLLVKAQTLKSEIIDKEKSNIQKAHPEEVPKTQKELDKGSGKKRKGKFRHLGGDFTRGPS